MFSPGMPAQSLRFPCNNVANCTKRSFYLDELRLDSPDRGEMQPGLWWQFERYLKPEDLLFGVRILPRKINALSRNTEACKYVCG